MSEDSGERIFDLAIANNWKLLELKRSGATLEEVFKNLTTRETDVN
jgi:hypothetical protein